MEILTSVKRLYIRFKSLVNDFVYSFGRAALLLLVEVQNHTGPVRERGRIRFKSSVKDPQYAHKIIYYTHCSPSMFRNENESITPCTIALLMFAKTKYTLRTVPTVGSL